MPTASFAWDRLVGVSGFCPDNIQSSMKSNPTNFGVFTSLQTSEDANFLDPDERFASRQGIQPVALLEKLKICAHMDKSPGFLKL